MALKIQHWFFDRLPNMSIQLSDSLIYDPSSQKSLVNKLPLRRTFFIREIGSTYIEELENLIRNDQTKNPTLRGDFDSLAASRVLKETTNNMKTEEKPNSARKPLMTSRVKSQVINGILNINGNRLLSPRYRKLSNKPLNDINNNTNKRTISNNKQRVPAVIIAKKESSRKPIINARRGSLQSNKKLTKCAKESVMSPRITKKPSLDISINKLNLMLDKRNTKGGFYSPRQRSEQPARYGTRIPQKAESEKLKQGLSSLPEKPELHEIAHNTLENIEALQERKQRRRRSDRIKSKYINNSIHSKENIM